MQATGYEVIAHILLLFTLQRCEFFSKSQRGFREQSSAHVVVYLAKVRIFQQITTIVVVVVRCFRLLFTLQRCEFFSKSQHIE